MELDTESVLDWQAGQTSCLGRLTIVVFEEIHSHIFKNSYSSLLFLLSVDKTDYMVGSYGPRGEEYEFLTPIEEAPKGMLARGSYNIRSKFTDDDKTDHLSWEWNLTIKKDWKD